MDSPAIEKIESLVHAATIGNPGTDVPTMLVPAGYKLASLEQYQDAPSRFRGVFSTRSIEDFAAYANEQAEPQVFIDIDQMRAAALFDLGTAQAPGHAEHRALLELKRTAPYADLLEANGNAFGQKDLAHWIEDWHGHIEGESTTGKDLSAKELATAVRKIEIKASSERTHEDGDWNAKRSGMDALDASAGSDTPAFIRFTCIPYEGLKRRTFDLRVSIIADENKPRIKLRITGLEGIQEEIAKEFKEVVSAHMDTDATLLLGGFCKE